MHGWTVIDKPVGPGSTRIVSAVKRALRDGGYPKLKVGHGGTLDPLASGVLPVAIGEATKLAGRMLDADKVYAFAIRFGEETDTLDAEGEVVARSAVRPTLAEVEAVLSRFAGEIEQVPPAYSALKVEGKRAYALARGGEEVGLKSRKVTTHSLSVRVEPVEALFSSCGEVKESPSTSSGRTEGGSNAEPLTSVTLTARVSKGTYIRSLARDIAYALETVGHVTMLRRLRAGPFTLEQAISLDKLSELAKARSLEQALLPLTAGLDDIPALPVTPDQARALREGRVAVGTAAQTGLHLATDQSVPVALVEADGGNLRVVRGFNM
ncbi:MAG TPA: tRNA pseudouridine(55) synthase TruB [Allosphingosinicella sp.]|nr:tRNA pseudouridine(55) synthase TruB [Allosphingosinicella sp.]